MKTAKAIVYDGDRWPPDESAETLMAIAIPSPYLGGAKTEKFSGANEVDRGIFLSRSSVER